MIFCSPASGPSFPLLLLAFYELLMCLGAAALPFPSPLLPLPQPCRTHAVPGTGCHQATPRRWQEGLSPQCVPMAELSTAPATQQLGPRAGAQTRAPGWCGWGLYTDMETLCVLLHSCEVLLQLLTMTSARLRVPSPAHAVRDFSGPPRRPPSEHRAQGARHRVQGAWCRHDLAESTDWGLPNPRSAPMKPHTRVTPGERGRGGHWELPRGQLRGQPGSGSASLPGGGCVPALCQYA